MARDAIVSAGVATGEQVKFDADEGLFVRDAGPNVFESGLYYAAPHASRGVSALPENSARSVPFPVGEETSFDRIAANVTSAGEAGAVLRLGLFGPSVDAEGAPLVVDAGTVAADTTGEKELTVDVTLAPGVYWPVAVAQNCPTTQPTVRAALGGATWLPRGHSNLASALSASILVASVNASVSGALPDTFGGSSNVSTAQVVALRAA